MASRTWSRAPAALLLPALAAAGGFPPRGAALLDAPLSAGAYWGLPVLETAARLGVSQPAEEAGLSPEWFVESALGRLWGLKPRGPRDGFSRVQVAPGAWLLAQGGKTIGYLVALPVREHGAHMDLISKRLGESGLVHLYADSPSPGRRETRFIHCFQWKSPGTEVVLLTAAPKEEARVLTDRGSGISMRLELIRKLEDPSVPMYLVLLDVRRPRKAGASA